MPTHLSALGLPPEQLARHIAVDFGVARLGRLLSRMLDVPFIEQRYSRLVIDCNRSLDDPASIAPVSDGVRVPGNQGLDPAAVEARRAEVFAPYHAAITRLIAERSSRGVPTILVALHSFTPVLAGKPRPWDIGVMHERGDTRFARAVLVALQREPGWRIGDNQPYALDSTDFSVPHHAYPAALPYVEIETSHACLAGPTRMRKVARLLAPALLEAVSELS